MSQIDSQGSTLTADQIHKLQNLIRQFKTLGARFAESSIPSLIEQFANRTNGGELLNAMAQNGSSSTTQRALPMPSSVETNAHMAPTAMQRPIQQVPRAVPQMSVPPRPQVQSAPTPPVATQQPAPQSTSQPQTTGQQNALSWQCYHSLLAVGCGKNADGSNSLMPSVSAIPLLKVPSNVFVSPGSRLLY